MVNFTLDLGFFKKNSGGECLETENKMKSNKKKKNSFKHKATGFEVVR